MSAKNISPESKRLPMFKALVGIGLMCGLLIALTYEGTFSRISHNRAEALKKAIYSVLPTADSIQIFSKDAEASFIRDGVEGEKIYAGFDKRGNLEGFAIEASGMGYADVITVLYAYSPEKDAIVGMRVLKSKETPGLGDKIEKDAAFLKSLEALDVTLSKNGKLLQNKIETVKRGTKTNAWEIDGITGATISSKAIGEMLAVSAEKWVPSIKKDLSVFQFAMERNDTIQIKNGSKEILQ